MVIVYNTFSIPEIASLADHVTTKVPLTAAPFIGVVIATVGLLLSTKKNVEVVKRFHIIPLLSRIPARNSYFPSAYELIFTAQFAVSVDANTEPLL